MKKQYIKPMIAVEYYELTQSIASCVTKFGFQGSSECVIKDADATDQMKDLAYSGFFTAEGQCSLIAIGMDENDKYCYHTNINAAFNS